MDRLEINKLGIFEQRGVLQLLYILRNGSRNVKELRKAITGRDGIMSKTAMDRALLLLTGIKLAEEYTEFSDETNRIRELIRLTARGETIASIISEFVNALNET